MSMAKVTISGFILSLATITYAFRIFAADRKFMWQQIPGSNWDRLYGHRSNVRFTKTTERSLGGSFLHDSRGHLSYAKSSLAHLVFKRNCQLIQLAASVCSGQRSASDWLEDWENELITPVRHRVSQEKLRKKRKTKIYISLNRSMLEFFIILPKSFSHSYTVIYVVFTGTAAYAPKITSFQKLSLKPMD